jgi:hypothetical protein
MPVGTIDYVSTVPWNDAFNPWPQYAQISLSALDANLNASGAPLIMQLSEFNPAAGEQDNWLYESLNQEGDTVFLSYNSSSNEVLLYDGNVGPYYALTTTTRAIPAGWLQGNENWAPVEGSQETTLSIVPVTTVLTPWEFRRRRLLELC